METPKSENKFDIFYFSSTHWDREWYQPFQGFRYRLVTMIDNLLEILQNDMEYKTFHFDGQTIVLEDYTEIEPEKKSILKKMIEEGRILIGPWYVMPDEFLVSGESLIRNLMKGHEVSKKWGQDAWKYGYICDCFGHIAQMPQIFNGFSIKYSLLGRGTKETDPAFFRWQSPDGSEVLNYKLEPDEGYGNFKMKVYGREADRSVNNPEIVAKIKQYIDAEIKRANIPVIIIMDGMDHSEALIHTTEYIKKIAELYPEASVHHVDLCKEGELAEQYKYILPVIKGELNKTAQSNHGYLHLITNTLSSYYPIKQRNDRCQNLLEKLVEPMCALSVFDGIKLNTSFLKAAYKHLLQNHPHDSICGCSITKVHKDMEYRFSQTEEICKALMDDYLYQSMRKNTCSDDYESILTIFNMLPFDIDKTITVDIDFSENYPKQYQEPFGYESINSFRIYDIKGNEIPYEIIDIKRGWKKNLHAGMLRMRDVHTVTFRAQLPACGKTQFKIVPSETPVRYLKKMNAGINYAENEFIRMDILSNGSLKITDKKTGKAYRELGNLINDGEIGDGWYHVNPVNDVEISTAGGSCIIEKTEHGPSRCVFKITRYMQIPEKLICDQYSKYRSKERVNIEVITFVGLSVENRYVDVKLSYNNIASDHRMRIVIPTGIDTDTYFSGQAFYCCKRKVGIDYTTQDWMETDQYEKSTNGIFGKCNEEGQGIAFVSSEGIHECAAYDDGTLTATLSRSFANTVKTNGEKECQINQNLNYSFALVPMDNEIQYADLIKIQDVLDYEFMTTFENVDKNTALKEEKKNLYVSGKNVVVSAIKSPENGEKDALIIRVFNASDDTTKGTVHLEHDILKVQKTNLNEEPQKDIISQKNEAQFELRPWEISTFKIYFNKQEE